jgi:adenosine deaminase
MSGSSQHAHHILIASLGASWAVVPEVLGWLAPGMVDLYACHPLAAQLDAERREHALTAPDEVWLLTTEGVAAQRSIEHVSDWWRRLEAVGNRPMPKLRVWQAGDTGTLATAEECRRWRELAFRAVLAAQDRAGNGGTVTLSLAGGRKTMSADLQDAGDAFGRHALLHVVADEAALRGAGFHDPQPESFANALPEAWAAVIRPLVVAGRSPGQPAMQVEVEGGPIDASAYPLPLVDVPCRWAADGRWLVDAVARRRSEAQRLLVAQAYALSTTDPYDPWPVLLRLEPGRIERLRAGRFGSFESDPLADPARWPLADLHRHLGGSIDLAAQCKVAAAVVENTPKHQLELAQAALERTWPNWRSTNVQFAGEAWPTRLRRAASALAGAASLPVETARGIVASRLLTSLPQHTLKDLLWTPGEPRVALKIRHPLGFAAYERPGELSGSALLGHPAAVDAYAGAVVDAARAEGLLYLELRCSPHKYRPQDPIGFVRDFEKALRRWGACTGRFDRRAEPRIGMIWIVDRRQQDSAADVVRAAVAAHEALPEFVLGLDLAGDESSADPADLAQSFQPALRACMRIAIHAGEGESPQNIWQAAYRLQADRIGHGLTLPQHPALAQRFRDRGVAIELCPTSNVEVVGFVDPSKPESRGLPTYPLCAMLDAGLPLTINADNPAISNTTVADEFLAAARMSGAMLSPWRSLALLRLAYRHAFVSAAERKSLEAAAAERLLDLANASEPVLRS